MKRAKHAVCVRRAQNPKCHHLIYWLIDFIFTAIGELQSELFDAKARSEEIAHAK